MIESSKSGKSIWCSVAINNRLETSRHWWNLRPFLCGGLSAVAMHVNNAWSQIDSSSLSSPSTHWLPSLKAGAALFPSSDWLCLEGSGGDGKSPAPFSHAVLAALAPHCSDLCVCCWHSTLGPLVNFSWDAVAQSCHLDTYYRPRLFWKVNLLHCTPKVLLLFFPHPFFLLAEQALWLAVMQCRSSATITVVASASSSMFLTPVTLPHHSPRHLPFHCHFFPSFSFFFFSFLFFRVFCHTDVWCWCGKQPPRSQRSSLENREGFQRPLTQGSRWGVRWSWAPCPAPHGARARPRHHIIHILKASWTETIVL